MLVKDLIILLEKMPQDSIVILQKDAEGNGYSPLSDVDSSVVYKAETTWYGEVYSTKWSAEDTSMSHDEWEKFKRKTPACVVLSPIN